MGTIANQARNPFFVFFVSFVVQAFHLKFG
jgi:hypothetical protein